jgi:superoxide reductase
MKAFGELFQTADWKAEKHVPVIECPDQVKAGESFAVTVTVGKEIAHPNTTEHHIRWIALYFHGEGDKFPYQLGQADFTAHGESVAGANQGPAYTHPRATIWVKLSEPGVLYATSYCNIHGLWQSSREIAVVS